MTPANITVIKKTDSMTKIQSKLNNKGIIQFTPGTYKITKQLIISSDTTIDLNGAILQRKGNLQSIFLNKVTPKTTKYTGDGSIVIQNGVFEGMGGYSYDNLLTFFHSHDILITNCEFRDTLCHAIEINSSSNVIVKKCKFLGYNLKDIDSAYKEIIQLDHAGYNGFVLNGSNKKSICYDGTCCNNIQIYDCYFSKSNCRDYPYACIGEHSQLHGDYKHKNINIHHNEFHCKKNPDNIQACISLTSMEYVDIHENTFDCNRVARIYSKNYSFLLNGDKVSASSGDGICKNINITSNIITGCTKETAFQQYNKSGSTKHKKINKEQNYYT